jgi:hypothetical protein
MRSELCGLSRRPLGAGIALCAMLAILVGLPGCAVWKRMKSPAPDVKPLREDRATKAISEF